MRIVHLDHTSVVGGAEFALLRMLRAHPSWSPVLLVAPATGRGLGIYDGVHRTATACAATRNPTLSAALSRPVLAPAGCRTPTTFSGISGGTPS